MMDSSEVDQIRETSRHTMHASAKRNWNVRVACPKCHYPTVMNDRTIGFCCHNCGKYTSIEKAKKHIDSAEFKNSDIGRIHILSSINPDKKEYIQFRDEHEIRADFYARGITRDNVGWQKFDRMLKRELVKNKCYRGRDKVGI